MKMKNISSSIAALFALSFASSASAATLVSYYTGDRQYAPSDYADNLRTPTSFLPVSGSAITQDGEQLRGWGPSIDLLRYAGFKIAAEPGYELLVDLFEFRSFGSNSSSASGSTSFQWSYRIDLNNDSFFNAEGEGWVSGELYVKFGPGFIDNTTVKQWDVDIRTTGTVEFGLFGSAPNLGLVGARSMEVIGSVNAVPEPSASLLTALGGLALLRRRRK